VSKKSRRTRRIADGSLRDMTWQSEEYERLMGAERREEQERRAKLERGACICRSRVIRISHGVYRTIHDPDCPKFKEWMTEHMKKSVNPSAAAHAAAMKEES
jgi:hypothetical protein